MPTLDYDYAFILCHGHPNEDEFSRPLSEFGRKQIKHLAYYLEKGIHLPTVFSSNERSALETVFIFQDRVHAMSNIQAVYDPKRGQTNGEYAKYIIDKVNEFGSVQLFLISNPETTNLLSRYILKAEGFSAPKNKFSYGEGIHMDMKLGIVRQLRRPRGLGRMPGRKSG